MDSLRKLGLVALWLVPLGCTPEDARTNKQEPQAKQAAPEVPAPLPTKEPDEPVVEPPAAPPAVKFDAALGQRFERVTEGIEVEPTQARERAPSWAAPSCALDYEFQIETGDVGNPAVTRIAGSWTALGAAPGMVLRQGKITTGLVGSQRRATELPAGNLAEVRLQTDGRSWTEVDGPTALWSAYGPWAGLSSFYPALPESGAAESRVDWIALVHQRPDTGRVEGERGSLEVPEGLTLPEPKKPIERRARVVVERWVDIDGTPAIVLRSWFELEDDGIVAHQISQGQYVVLESGVLLHAELRERTRYRIGEGQQASEYEVAIDGEARLVRGCVEPVLSRFE